VGAVGIELPVSWPRDMFVFIVTSVASSLFAPTTFRCGILPDKLGDSAGPLHYGIFTSSTRRFLARPPSVLLSATGLV
jgi:hypothetical protein